MISFNLNKENFQKSIQEKIKRIDQAIINRFTRVGEQFVIDARNNGSYLDQTGNLRSSIGYVVLRGGKKVAFSDFGDNSGGDGEGSGKGKKFIDKLAKYYPDGYVLICVAGMEYAAAVESRGKDVITGSTQLAADSLKKVLTQILKNN